MEKTIDDLVDELFAGSPRSTEVPISFPSENRVYNLEDESSPVTLRPMVFEDEKALVSSKNEIIDPVNTLLSRCVSNINIEQLLSFDKLYLLLKLREISYGDDYSCLLICQKCKAENKKIIKLSELNVYPVPDDFKDPIKITLPILKKEVEIRYPRVRDEKFIENIFDNLWRFINSVDGHTDKALISKVVKKLSIADIKFITKNIETPYGVDTKVKFECDKCGGVSVVDLPFDSNFFDVSL